jgi:hypothetical protein
LIHRLSLPRRQGSSSFAQGKASTIHAVNTSSQVKRMAKFDARPEACKVCSAQGCREEVYAIITDFETYDFDVSEVDFKYRPKRRPLIDTQRYVCLVHNFDQRYGPKEHCAPDIMERAEAAKHLRNGMIEAQEANDSSTENGPG